MINYVPHKPIDYKRIKQLLKKSEEAHIFTNNGPIKQELERLIHQKLQLKEDKKVVCLNSGTAALYVLISLFEKRAGKPLKWVTTAFNFPACTVNKLRTKIVDITSSLSPSIAIDDIEDADGIIIPTLFGTIPESLESLERYCQSTKKILILDNASSPLSRYQNKNINEYGTACIGSAHQTKFWGAGEAGFAVVPTSLYDEANYLANFGFDDERKYNNLGTNAKLSDIAAAFVMSHIESYDMENHIKVQNKYIDNLKRIPNLEILGYYKDHQIVYGNMPVVFNKYVNHLAFRDVGIEANRYYKPLQSLPNSVSLFTRIVNFPLYSTLTDHQLGIILKKIEIEAKK